MDSVQKRKALEKEATNMLKAYSEVEKWKASKKVMNDKETKKTKQKKDKP